MLASTLLAALLGLGPDPAAAAGGPIGPTLIPLDFRSSPIGEVVEALGRRSGNPTDYQDSGRSMPDTPLPRVTLEGPGPVPFWEAVDRLCAEAHLQRQLNVSAGIQPRRSTVQFVRLSGGPVSGDQGPALYTGPFRLGQFRLHMHYQREFVPRPHVEPAYLEAVGPFWAEYQVLTEPRILATRTGPVRIVEAIDDRGQSLLGPNLDVPTGPPRSWNHLLDRPTTVRLALRRPEEPGRRLVRLRGFMPVEAALRPADPALDVPLVDAEGRSFEVGDLIVRILEYRAGEQSTHVRYRIQIGGPRGDVEGVYRDVLSARLAIAQTRLLEFAAANGRPAGGGSGGGGPAGVGTLEASYHFSRPPPTRLRIYDPDWVAWYVPFTFADVLIP